MFSLLFAVLAVVCFLLGGFGVPAKVNWDQLGKACVVLAWIGTVYAGMRL